MKTIDILAMLISKLWSVVDFLSLDNIKTVAFSESRCIVCQKSTPGSRTSINDKAKQDIWLTEKIFLPRKTRACSNHLFDNGQGLFTPDAKAAICGRSKHGPTVDGKEISSWLENLTAAANKKQTCVNFDSEFLSPEAYQDLTGLKKHEFEDLLKYVEPELNKSKNRSARNGLAIFLAKLRLGVSQKVLARLFGVTSQAIISRTIHRVCKILIKNFVPQHLGFAHLSRSQLLTVHNPEYVKKMFDISAENMVLVLDGTYIYVQQASDHETQNRMYSCHKHRNLAKFMMVTTPDGYVVHAYGPFGADGKCSDANILNRMLQQENNIMSLLKTNDFLILDRGFRDSVAPLAEKGIRTALPEFLTKAQKQFTTAEANRSRKVTLVRWEVESVNGRLKNKFDFFDNVVPISYTPIIGDLFHIACSIVNKFFTPLFQETKRHDRIIENVKARIEMENELKAKVEKFDLHRNVQWKKANEVNLDNFPVLTDDDLFEITLGSFQLKNASRYNSRHLSKNPLYELFLHKETQNIVRAKLQSRFRRAITHSLWVEYDNTKTGANQILGFYCKCQQGARTVGTCSHITAVLVRLGKDRYESKNDREKPPFYSYLLDNADREVSGSRPNITMENEDILLAVDDNENSQH